MSQREPCIKASWSFRVLPIDGGDKAAIDELKILLGIAARIDRDVSFEWIEGVAVSEFYPELGELARGLNHHHVTATLTDEVIATPNHLKCQGCRLTPKGMEVDFGDTLTVLFVYGPGKET